MRWGWLLLITIFCYGQSLSQQSKIDVHLNKINKLLPTLSTNATNTDLTSQSNISIDSDGIIRFTTTNSRKGKAYDKSEFDISARELDKDKLKIKKIECCNVLELYCEDKTFDCVEFVDRTSKQVRPVPYILMSKNWKENQHVIFNLERLIEAVSQSPGSSKERKSTVVQLHKNGGIYLVNIKLGNKPATAILDSGASVVSISKKLERELLKDKIITKRDYISPAKYRIANGDILTAKRFVLPSLTVGKLKMRDVVCSIVDDATSILLGKSFLDQFAKWSIDNDKQTLTLER